MNSDRQRNRTECQGSRGIQKELSQLLPNGYPVEYFLYVKHSLHIPHMIGTIVLLSQVRKLILR